jgi:uncharacterized phage protein (TIGR01671 family)
MREIKFRAWDKVDEKMLQVYNLCFDCGESIYANGKLICMMGKDGCLYPKKRTILLQYTGLHDKNGKEIYEEDVVKSSCRDIYGRIFIGQSKYMSVGVHLFGVSIEFENGIIEPWMYDNGKFDWEVIGNIYQNPELKGGVNVS